MNRLIRILSLLFALVLSSCSAPEVQDDENQLIMTQEELDEYEPEDTLSVSVSFSDREYKGMTLFMQHCNKCHPGGYEGEGPSLIDKKMMPDMLIHFQVRTGLGDMPSFNKDVLSKTDVKRIAAFIQLLRDEAGTNKN